MRKVYTYQSITELRQQPYYQELISCPLIVATTNMQYAMTSFYGELRYVINIYPLQKTLIGNWLDTFVVMGQYVNLCSVLRQMSNVPDQEKNVYEAFLKSKREVLNSIRALVEAEVYPDDIAPVSIEERMFKDIWEKVEETDPSFGMFRASLDQYWTDEAFFADSLRSFDAIIRSNVVVLHGFYYITALQERLFDLFEKHGKQLVFLCCIDKSLPEVEEVWFSTLTQTDKFSPTNEWTGINSEKGPAYNFGKVFSRIDGTETPKNIRVIKYENEATFISDVRRIDDEGYSIFSTDAAKTEVALKEIFPEKFKRRHLLSYPVGQFFYTLHSMWDAKVQSLRLSIDDIQNCFASGWVVSGNDNGRNYIHSLEMMKTFFNDCSSVDDWEERISQYKLLYTGIKDLFEKHISGLPKTNARWHRIMSNPFLNLSCFSLENDEADRVLRLIKTLINTAKGLFGNGSEIDIASHFKKINELISKGEEEAAMYREECAIIEELSERIKNPHFEISKCLPEDVSDAVMMVIGGGILDEDNYEVLSASDEHFIRSLFQVETSSIVAEGKIHICLADENRLPGMPKSYSWPLCSDFLRRLANAITGRRSQYLKNYIFVNEGTTLASRYLFFSALQNTDVEISWIAEENGKEIAESPYIRILSSVFGCEIESFEKKAVDNIEISTLRVQPDLSITTRDEDMKIAESQMDLALCPWKFIYGYLTSQFPSYRNDFHYKFVLATLIGAFAKVTGYPVSTAADNVLACFVYLKDVEKRQIQDYVTKLFPVDGTDSLDDVSYVMVRLMPHFISKSLVKDALDRVDRFDDSSYAIDLLHCGSDNYEICLYCQFRDECIHAIRERNAE